MNRRLEDVEQLIQQVASIVAALTAVNAQAGTSYTATPADAGRLVTMDSDLPNTFALPSSAAAAFEIGSRISVSQIGGGDTRIVAASGVTLNGVPSGVSTLTARYSLVSLIKIGPDAWIMHGDHGLVV